MNEVYDRLVRWMHMNVSDPNDETFKEICEIINLLQATQLGKITELDGQIDVIVNMLANERIANGKEYLSELDDTH